MNAIVTDGRTLRGMTKAGFIVWTPGTDRHWTGMMAKRYFVKEGPRLIDRASKLNWWIATPEERQAMQRAMDAGQVRFNAPPVCTAYWDRDSWLKHIDWSLEVNARELAYQLDRKESSRGMTYDANARQNRVSILDEDGFFMRWV